MQMTATDSSYLVLVPLAPLLFALYLHLIAVATLPSPTSMAVTSSTVTNTNSVHRLHHHEFYIEGADLIVLVRKFTIGHRVCRSLT
jgi:hypothetical protein